MDDATLDCIERLGTVLDELRESTGASSCTFYLRDPLWEEELRLIQMPGVKHPEPMHGFPPRNNFPEVATHDNGIQAAYLYPARQSLPGLPNVPDENRHLFGDFAHREGVAACARLSYATGGRIQALLFVNFTSRRRLDSETLQAKWRHYMTKVVALLPGLTEEVEVETSLDTPTLVRILQPVRELAEMAMLSDSVRLGDYVQPILDAAFRAFNLGEDTAVGTFHTWDAASRELHLAASKGGVSEAARCVSLDAGDGLIAWVAYKRRALTIPDLTQSAFRQIYREIHPGVRSELAVPVMAGKELLGVVNLESTVPNVFPPIAVRAVSYAADQTAFAFSVVRHAVRAEELETRTARLLQVSQFAARGGDGAQTALGELASLAAESLKANRCDIWRYDRNGEVFLDGGASYAPFDATTVPRADGWSAYIRKHKTPVWVRGNSQKGDVSVLFWSSDAAEWSATRPSQTCPSDFNERSIVNQGGGAELGIPILLRNEGVGVAWIEFPGSNPITLSAQEMVWAQGFAGQAGLVIDSLERNADLAQKRQFVKATKEFQESLLPQGAEAVNGLEVFVRSVPDADIGGDFHAVEALDEDSTAFLIGDTQGHGPAAALGMIPLLTTFRLFFRQSRSTKHMMEKLLLVADEMKIKATALSFIICRVRESRSTEKTWLFASSAGHPPLLILRAGPLIKVEEFPRPDGPSRALMLGVAPILSMGEDRCQLFPGDLVVAYTDGLPDVHWAGQEFGKEAIQHCILAHRNEPVARIARALEDEARRFGRDRFKDDATIIVVRVTQ